LKIETPIKNLLVEVKNKTLVVSHSKQFKIMSSAVLNGGLKQARTIISCQVPRNYNHENPEEILLKRAGELKLPSPLVGMLTAVDLQNLATSTDKVSKRNLLVIATAGISNASQPGEPQSTRTAGTINLIVLYDGNMTEGCMVNAVQTTTEAKSATLRRLDIRTRKTGILATGTSTDTVAICCLGDGKALQYAGSATEIGDVIGRTVESSIQNSLRKQEGLVSGRLMASRLEERGIPTEEILKATLELFVPHPGVEKGSDAKKILRRELEKALDDVNVCCLISAGMRLEEDSRMGLIPQMEAEEFNEDPTYLLADEMIGRQIADYIGGTKASFEFHRFDREKPGILRKLGPVMDDVIAGVAAGISSKMYSAGLEEAQH